MEKTTKTIPNKLLHRFYEALVLLKVLLESAHGERMPRQRNAMSSPDNANRYELLRRFLESLAYVCDHEKGGDSMTAIFVSSGPLVYHVACNKRLPEPNKVVPFLRSVLEQLGSFKEPDEDSERHLLAQCVQFSEKRVGTYERFLRNELEKCQEIVTDTKIRQSKYDHRNIDIVVNHYNQSSKTWKQRWPSHLVLMPICVEPALL